MYLLGFFVKFAAEIKCFGACSCVSSMKTPCIKDLIINLNL